jgi:S1-C subfamily serine protease
MPYDERPDYSHRSQPSRRPGTPISVILIPLFVVLGLGGAYYLLHQIRRNPQDAEAQLRVVAPKGDYDAIEKNRIQVFKAISPSVVNVDTLRIQRTGYIGTTERQQGTGSGFFWDKQGRIVTNSHVILDSLEIAQDGTIGIKPSATIRITMADQSSWNARLVGVAPDYDLAVIQVDAPESKLTPIPIGSSEDLQVGQTVFAIGNPFGQSLTFTQGIVSALDREIQSVTDRPITGVIQTDASLNPGNSGGPMLDKDGRLIGVNTAITSPTGGNVGIGYAIPVDTVNRVVTDLIRTGRTARPALGVVLLNERDSRNLGEAQGVMIAEVRSNSPASKAGLKGFSVDQESGQQMRGDIIRSIDGTPTPNALELSKVMSRLKIHQTVKVVVMRNGKEKEVEVTLGGI